MRESPPITSSPGGARPALLALVVLGATALVVLAYGLLTTGGKRREEGPAPAPPKAPAVEPTPAPRAAEASTTKAPPIVHIPAATQPAAALPEVLKGALFHEPFSGPLELPGPKWVATRDGDFKEAAVGVVDGRLRIRVGTIGTRDDTVKHLGIRSAQPVVDLSAPVELSAEIDWNNQANGCYLQAALYLCPTATEATAAAERDWLKFEYVGVPPGKNARACLSRRLGGNLRILYDEGWPTQQKAGRTIGRQQVALRLGPETIELIENGKALFGPQPHGCRFPRAYLYLEVSSHSNYPPREIFFDALTLRPTP